MRRGVSQLDLDMFYKLFMMADRDILTNLDSSVLHFDDIKAYKDALSTIDIREDVCFACAGYECKESLLHSRLMELICQLYIHQRRMELNCQ